MTIHHVTCDLCGEVIENGVSLNGREISHGRVTTRFHPNGARHVDICQCCLDEIRKEYGIIGNKHRKENQNENQV